MKNLLSIILFFITWSSCETPHNATYSSKLDISKVIYEGGDGKSFDDRIIIRNAPNERSGVAAEYSYIEKKHGSRNIDWKFLRQGTGNKNGNQFDIVTIQTISQNETVTYYFDISDFFGKR